ncbi:MAG: hypothetical protein K2I19_09885 [Muribaculaceae bacterium]|nr:hypothetical protein [Muribaculaceae bacterium]
MFNELIKTPAQLGSAITSTYIYSLIIAVVMVLIMVIVANMIPWEPGRRDNSGSKRRVAFFVLMVLTLVAPVIVNYFMFFNKISTPAFRSDYMMHMGLAGVAAAVVYFIIGFVLVKMQSKKTKLESIFPKNN